MARDPAPIAGSGSFSLWDADGKKHDFTIKNGGVYTKVGKKDELVGDLDVTGRYRVKLGGQVVTGSLTDHVAAHDIALKRTDGKTATDQLQIGHDPVPEGILVLPEAKFTVKDGQMTPAGGKHVQGTVTVIRRGAALDQLTLHGEVLRGEPHRRLPGLGRARGRPRQARAGGGQRAAAGSTTRCAL